MGVCQNCNGEFKSGYLIKDQFGNAISRICDGCFGENKGPTFNLVRVGDVYDSKVKWEA